MDETVIEYVSDDRNASISGTTELEAGSQDGLNWTVTYSHQLAMLSKLTDCAFLTWNFEWNKLHKQGINGFSGHIRVIYRRETEKLSPMIFDVEVTHPEQEITRRIGTTSDIKYSEKYTNCYISFEYCLKPYRISTRSLPIDQIFLQSSHSDTILVVEGRNMHVNKAYLSIHSDYFQTLFTANFMEKSMSEIPIGDVRYEDFSRLLAIISTKPAFPTDESIEPLLVLAQRFLMPAVTDIVEHHLLYASQLDFFKILGMGDKYKLKKVIEKCVGMFTTLGQLSRNKHLPEYNNLDKDTKSKILDHLVEMN